jgi:hypothetical protein
MIRLHPPDLPHSPFDCFSLLLLGDGYTPGSFTAVATAAWAQICTTPPFNLFTAPGSGRYAVGVWCDDAAGVTLTRTGSKLELSSAELTKLETWLGGQKVPSDSGPVSDADDVWPRWATGGCAGSLIAIVKKGTAAAQLYGTIPDTDLPRPVVGVVETGANWTKVITRALGQLFAGLGDEFELEGSEFAAVPDAIWAPPHNILFVTPSQQTDLATKDPRTVAPEIVERWGLPLGGTAPKVHAHVGTAANPPLASKPTGGIQLVEGAGYHRTRAYRADFDCLMRRLPTMGTAGLEIQDTIEFCAVCRKLLTDAIRGTPIVTPRPRIQLGSQRIQYDDATWPARETPALPYDKTLGPHPPAPAGGPRWACRVEANQTVGLRISGLKLSDRPGDPFTAATDIMESIEFRDLAVRFGTEAPTRLDPAQAFQNKTKPPVLEIGRNPATTPIERIGVKLTLTWEMRGLVIEGSLSLVMRGMRNDFDPGGAAEACKFFPQIALRWEKAPTKNRKSATKLPTVSEFRARLAMTANNVIPGGISGVPHELHHHLRGTHIATLIVDSNASDNDNRYEFDFVDTPLLAFGLRTAGQPVPEFGFWDGEWKAGRKLAGVMPTLAEPSPGATARVAHLRHAVPGLPHWSWLFDYAVPKVAATKRFVGVYPGPPFLGSGDPQAGERSAAVTWPAAADQKGTAKSFEAVIRKTARQGAYDSVHIAADMGTDADGRQITPAPFCADLCMHIHWRWGTVATGAARQPHAYLGWGSGREDLGAHSLRGAPLTPPNQRVEVEVEPLSAGARTAVSYEATIYAPRQGERQVVLEQGIGLAFTYNGLRPNEIALLVGGLERSRDPGGLEKDLKTKKSTAPVAYDTQVRTLFHTGVYPAIAWYSDDTDEVNKKTVGQIPAGTAAPKSTPPASLEAL